MCVSVTRRGELGSHLSMEEEIIVSGYVQPVLDALAYHGAHDLLDDVKRLDVYIYIYGRLVCGGSETQPVSGP